MAGYPLPPWLSPQAALGWGDLAAGAAKSRLNAQLEQANMAQRSAEFAIESQQRSQEAAQANQAHKDALDYNHQVEQQKIAIDQQYKQQQIALDQQSNELAQKQFDAKTSAAAQAHLADQAFQKAILPKEQGGEGLDPIKAALKYRAGSMTSTELGRLAGATAGVDAYKPGDTLNIPNGGTMVNTGGKRWQVLPTPPATITNPPEPLSVTNSAGKYLGDVIQLPGQKPVFHPTASGKTAKETPMDVLRKKQQEAQGGGKAESYKSKDDVVKAFKDGKLSRDEAAKVLNSEFGVPLK